MSTKSDSIYKRNNHLNLRTVNQLKCFMSKSTSLGNAGLMERHKEYSGNCEDSTFDHDGS